MIHALADQDVPIYGDGYRDDSVHVNEKCFPCHYEQAPGYVLPNLFRISHKEAEEAGDVGDTVYEDHAVHQGGVLELDPVENEGIDGNSDYLCQGNAKKLPYFIYVVFRFEKCGGVAKNVQI